MPEHSITDSDFFAGWKQYVLKEDDLRWEGRRPFQLIIRFLHSDYYHDVDSGVTSPILLYISLLIFTTYLIYQNNPWLGICLAVIGSLAPFVYEYWFSWCHAQTRYAITNQFVLFKCFNGFRTVIHAIPLNNIVDLRLVEYPDQKGKIALIVDEPVNFSTYELRNGLKQDHPNIELDQTSKAVYDLIRQSIQIRPSAFKYRPPKVKISWINLIKKCALILWGFMSLYLIDFYLLPSFNHEDHISVEYRRYTLGRDLGGQYLTAQNYHFATYDYSVLKDQLLLVTHSPLFGTTKKVMALERSHTYPLKSSLNGWIVRWLFIFTYGLLFAVYWRTLSSQPIDYDTFLTLLISSLGMISLLFTFWFLHN